VDRLRPGLSMVRGGLKDRARPAARVLDPAPSAAPSAPAGGYMRPKLTCRQIGNYARSQELLRQGHTYLDKNGDGWPANRCAEPV